MRADLSVNIPNGSGRRALAGAGLKPRHRAIFPVITTGNLDAADQKLQEAVKANDAVQVKILAIPTRGWRAK